MRKVVIEYFENIWEGAKRERKRQILELLEESGSNAKLLDLGCDDGKYSLKWGKRVGTNSIYGIDINKDPAEKAAERGIKVKVCDLNYKFPFRSTFFDVVVADQVIEHLWDLDNFVSEIKRVLKRGGYLVISTENLASWHNVFSLVLGLQPSTGPTPSTKFVAGFHPLTPNIEIMVNKYEDSITMPGHTKVMTSKTLVELLKFYNFSTEDIMGSGYFPLPHKISKLASLIDKYHSFFITVKTRIK